MTRIHNVYEVLSGDVVSRFLVFEPLFLQILPNKWYQSPDSAKSWSASGLL